MGVSNNEGRCFHAILWFHSLCVHQACVSRLIVLDNGITDGSFLFVVSNREGDQLIACSNYPSQPIVST
jgi:hypothetical protein